MSNLDFPTRSPSQAHFFEHAVLQRRLSYQLFELLILTTQLGHIVTCGLPSGVAN